MQEITRRLARYVVESRFDSLPEAVRHEGPRAFVNWFGCVLGGCRDISLDTAQAALAEYCGPPQATIIGRGRRTDIINAAFFNCLSSSSQAYDDTHLATIAHPTGVTAAGMLALAEHKGVSGRDFLHALILGIELQCRMSRMLVEPPAKSALGMFMTGFTGAMGAAAAAGKLLGLDEQRMIWALGIAATQGGGFRETHGTMTVGFVRAHAARCGLVAALLAEVKDSPQERLVHETVLRSQSQAAYAPENLGHFGLALARYAHFTSPIRRYADLLVHRALIRGLKLGSDGLAEVVLLEIEPVAGVLDAGSQLVDLASDLVQAGLTFFLELILPRLPLFLIF